MELKGESLIAASRTAVWSALNDPAVLARCIDGVESLTAATDANGARRLDGKMNARVGPVRATFAGGVTLTEVDAPNRYVLVGEGKGGVAGFAKGSAEVTLADADVDGVPGTRLAYAVTSSVGGKLAQLGARLIEGTARGYAETFFTRFKAEVEMPVDAAPVVAPAMASPQVATPNRVDQAGPATTRTGLSPLVWGMALILIVIAVLVWQLR
jgi:carbon monoxide dehydrogenase subunit G